MKFLEIPHSAEHTQFTRKKFYSSVKKTKKPNGKLKIFEKESRNTEKIKDIVSFERNYHDSDEEKVTKLVSN